jgi:hypothetical protein
MDDRRSEKRSRTYKSGKILLGTWEVPCTVRNLSKTGGCLEVQTTYGIPGTFEFILPDHPSRTCRVIWMGDTKIGVQFQ